MSSAMQSKKETVCVQIFLLNTVSLFQLLEQNIITFVKNELKRFKRVLSPDGVEHLEEKSKVEDMISTEEEEHTSRSREAFLKITLNFLRRMKLDELAESLQNSKSL